MAERGDVELETASGKPTSVLKILTEMKKRWDEVEPAREKARRHELAVYGRHTAGGPVLEDSIMGRGSLAAPIVTKNKLKNILLTWAARQSKDRTSAYAYPNDAEDTDLAVSEVSNAILDLQRQYQDRDAMMSRAALLCGMHGTMGFYTTWDYDMGPRNERVPLMDPATNGLLPLRDPMTGEVIYKTQEGKGDPGVELLTIFDFVTDGAPNVKKDGRWLLVRRLLDPDDAQAALREAIASAEAEGREVDFDDTVSAQRYQNHLRTGAGREAVEAWEMWWRPNKMARFGERGLFAVVISGKVVTSQPFPFAHGRLPLAVWRCMDQNDEFYGLTWVEDALPSQLALNHALMVLAYRAEIAGQVRALMSAGLKSKWGTSADGQIECDQQEQEQGVDFPQVPPIPTDMYEMCDRYEQAIADVAGVSDVAASGDAAAETKNARLVAYATQVDEQKGEHTARNRDEAELEVDQQVLELWQQFVSVDRLVRVIGADNSVSAAYFKGAELRGVDVRLEAQPGAERSGAAKAKDADDRVLAGQMDPVRGGELARTGLPGTVDEARARSQMQALIQQAMGGAPVQADLTIPSEVAVPFLKQAIGAFAAYGPKFTMPIRALLQEYMEQGASMGPQGQPGAQAAPTGGPPQPQQPQQPQMQQQDAMPGAQPQTPRPR